jgi:hypothetical protein
MKNIIAFTLFMALLAVSSWAQDVEVAKLRDAASANALGTRPASNPFSLLDLSKMSWSHSYTFGFVSGAGTSGSMGILNNTMFYEFSPALSLRLDIGIMHNSGAIWGDANNDATLLPGFQLDYHPSDKFSLTVGMTRYNPAVMPYYMPSFGYGRYNNSWRYQY